MDSYGVRDQGTYRNCKTPEGQINFKYYFFRLLPMFLFTLNLWNTLLIEKLVVAQMVNKFPAFEETEGLSPRSQGRQLDPILI
jgi:hypothetical protein